MTSVAIADQINESRRARLIRELQGALAKAPPGTGKEWAGESVKILGAVFVRRGRNIATFGKRLGAFLKNEWQQSKAAFDEGRFRDHALSRSKEGAHSAKELANSLKGLGVTVSRGISNNPKEKVPEAAIAMLAFLVGSGGLDGDGGAPDLDLMFGIDAHRSILSHSILIAGTFEAALLSSALLVTTIHSFLPEDRDPLWNAIEFWSRRYAVIAGAGLSAGVAYHLAVDGLLQPAAYKDLPFAMTLEAHQAIFGANAAAEAIDVSKRKAPVS